MNPIDCPTEALLEAHPSEVASPVDALALIIDPERALNAARRMELSCRNGLRFYSDFRRVRSLDELDAAEVDSDAELVEDNYSPFDSGFDPDFSRRL
jgi:hypothetical protein